jgi:hypothetical protein
MDGVIQTTFRRTIDFLPSEIEVMPLSRWTESVLRYYFCRTLATAHPEIEQFVECDKIDLVLSQSPLRAFIEFKFIDTLSGSIHTRGSRRASKAAQGEKTWESFKRASINSMTVLPGLASRSTSRSSMRIPRMKADQVSDSPKSTTSTNIRAAT